MFAASRRFYVSNSLISNRKLLLLLLRARAARNFCILESVFAIFALIFSTSGVSKERSVMSRISSERPHILVDDGLVDDGLVDHGLIVDFKCDERRSGTKYKE